MQISDQAEYNRRSVACPVHGRGVHLQRFAMPDPGEFFAAQYVCGHCEPVPASFVYLLLAEETEASDASDR